MVCSGIPPTFKLKPHWADHTFCNELKPHCAHFCIFSPHSPGDPFKERESPMIKDDQGGSIRREERAKMLDAILHSRHTTFTTTPLLAFKSLSSRRNQKLDSFHGLKLYTLEGEFSTVRLKYKFLQEMSVNLAATATCGLKSFSNSLLNGRFRGPIKSNGVIKCKSGQ